MKLLHLSLMCTLSVQPLKFHLTVHEHGSLSPASKTVTFSEDSSPVRSGLEVPESEELPDGIHDCWRMDSLPQTPDGVLFDYTTDCLSAAAWVDSHVSEQELKSSGCL